METIFSQDTTLGNVNVVVSIDTKTLIYIAIALMVGITGALFMYKQL